MKKLIIIILLFFSVQWLFGQGEIYKIKGEYYRGNQVYCAGVKTDIFKYSAASQENDNWCWAACVQMVLHYQGVYVSQRDLVRKAFGTTENRPANGAAIVRAANGWRVDGKTIVAGMGNKSTINLIDDLAFHYPVIIGLDMPGQNVGHAFVLTAIFYYYDDNNTMRPYKVVLRDPWGYNDNPSRHELGWSDFYNRINTIVHVYPQN